MSKVVSGMLKQEINGVVYETLLCPYMVGDVLITTNNISPATRYKGTTWQKIEEETFLMSASETYPVKSKGGSNTKTITIENLPPHKHLYSIAKQAGNQNWSQAGGYSKVDGAVIGAGETRDNDSSNAMKSKPFNNMPKFFAVNMWIRVA